ncbi:hypothetical protein H0H81_003301 [Sphagnurus paluster]|uniref:L-tryptophan decarboxylase PsiD-like domain-containing protein n=1 Tax=Sphagnurus paluster TaxID=117069 RepID=A0A9P7KHM9_9AGAR|nr:hypothetical protein H0H81_003301 [Sphagnurus paluster]
MTPSNIVQHRVGGWLPQDHNIIRRWLAAKIEQAEKSSPVDFVPVIKDFQNFIEGDDAILALFTEMFTQVPHRPPYNLDPSQQPQATPEFTQDALVGFPINAILDWPMGTPSGFTAFYLRSVNTHMAAILNTWGNFLMSEDSRYVLNSDPGGWFSPVALEEISIDDYIADPTLPYYGFTSWDNFFTRQFKDGKRPVPDPEDKRIITSACESAVYNFVSDVRYHDLFWLKEKSYSLADMLAGHQHARQFAKGTVYQAYLSALNYHRWHAPVSGTVVDTQLVPGTYYSETPVVGMDPSAPNNSQGYLTAVATRAMIYIQADNHNIGLMCFMAVGMAEVSTCEITVQKGDVLKQGQEIGMFHFGGSTHCLIFRPETKVQFVDTVKIGADILLNAPIAFVDDK